MFCNKCGNKINDNLNFCPACGNQIKSVNNINSNIEPGNTKPSNSNPTIVKHPKKNSSKIVIVFVILGVLLGSLSLFNLFNEDKGNNKNNPFVGEWYCWDYYSRNPKYNHKVVINNDNTYIYGDPNDFNDNRYQGNYELNYVKNYDYEINFKLDYMIVDGKQQTPKNEYMHYEIKQLSPLYYNNTIIQSAYMGSKDTGKVYTCINEYIPEYSLGELKSFY